MVEALARSRRRTVSLCVVALQDAFVSLTCSEKTTESF
jgi:hypothetical protein